MILKHEIERVFNAQQEQQTIKPNTIERSFLMNFQPSGRHTEVISGVRRCGKSTLMKQILNQYQKTAYFNFEDARIYGFGVDDFPKLDQVIGTGLDAYFFDEIQNVPSWEVFIRQLHDRNDKVFITGSNASLLSRELGTRLTGRHLRHELFPFSYFEFLKYKDLEHSATSFDLYNIMGGFPEYLESENPEILQSLLKDIVFRDIAVRYNIRNTGNLMDLTLYLFSNIGKEFSYNNLRKILSIGSATSVSDYLSWLGDSYLLYFLPRFSWSAKNVAINPRKVYAVDNGMINSCSSSFTEDSGRLLENTVFLFLRGKRADLYYFKQNQECDFVVFDNRKCKFLIQVCHSLNNENLKRETEGLREAMVFFKMKEGYVLTLNQRDEFRQNEGIIHVLPVRDFIHPEG